MSEPSDNTAPRHSLGAARYPIDQLLEEVESERNLSARAKELVDQTEILKLFENAGDAENEV